MSFLRLIPILLALSFILPGYAAQALTLPAHEELPANAQKNEPTNPEKASEETQQEPGFLETKKGKALVATAIAITGIGTLSYVSHLLEQRVKAKWQKEREEQLEFDRQKNLQRIREIPNQRRELSLPRVAKILKAFGIDPQFIPNENFLKNKVLIGENYVKINLAEEQENQHKQNIPASKKQTLLEEITTSINNLNQNQDRVDLVINKQTGDLTLRARNPKDYQSRFQPANNILEILRDFGSDEKKVFDSMAPDIFEKIAELNNEIQPKQSLRREPYQDIGFAFQD